MDFNNSDSNNDRAMQIMSLAHQMGVELAEGDAQAARALTPLSLQALAVAIIENAIGQLGYTVARLRPAAAPQPVGAIAWQKTLGTLCALEPPALAEFLAGMKYPFMRSFIDEIFRTAESQAWPKEISALAWRCNDIGVMLKQGVKPCDIYLHEQSGGLRVKPTKARSQRATSTADRTFHNKGRGHG